MSCARDLSWSLIMNGDLTNSQKIQLIPLKHVKIWFECKTIAIVGAHLQLYCTYWPPSNGKISQLWHINHCQSPWRYQHPTIQARLSLPILLTARNTRRNRWRRLVVNLAESKWRLISSLVFTIGFYLNSVGWWSGLSVCHCW